MPYFQLNTNVPKSKITDEFLTSTSKLVASTLGKPESVSFSRYFIFSFLIKFKKLFLLTFF